MTERRTGSTLRRNINAVGMRGGEMQESKVWAQVGKGLCVWLIYKHAETLVNRWETLFVLLLFLLMPELIKKFITMRYGGGVGAGYTQRTERVERTNTVETGAKLPISRKVDVP